MTDRPPLIDPDDPALLAPAFGPLERFDVASLAAAHEPPWWHQSLARVNDCLFRVSLVEGDYDWHRHAGEDELFFVLQGGCDLDVEGRASIPLAVGQGAVLPRGTRHRPRAAARTVLLLVEGAGILPSGD